MLLLSTFYHNGFFKNNIPGTLPECQAVGIYIRTDLLSVLIWVQTVCKGYQQMTKVTIRKKRVKHFLKPVQEKRVHASLTFYPFSSTCFINLIKHEHSCKILYMQQGEHSCKILYICNKESTHVRSSISATRRALM